MRPQCIEYKRTSQARGGRQRRQASLESWFPDTVLRSLRYMQTIRLTMHCAPKLSLNLESYLV